MKLLFESWQKYLNKEELNEVTEEELEDIDGILHNLKPEDLSFGNIFGEELVIAALGMMVAFLVPVPMMLFGVFGGVLQAFVFIMLTMVYLEGAVASEEH